MITNQTTPHLQPAAPSACVRHRWSVLALLLALLSGLAARPAQAVPPPNDDITGAVIVTEPLPFTHSVATGEATVAADEPVSFCAETEATVWYVHTPTADGVLLVDTIGSDYDTVLTVFSGAPGSLEFVDCSDDALGIWPSSRLRVSVQAGVPCYFAVGVFAGSPAGTLVFNARIAPPSSEVVATIDFAEPVQVNPVTGEAEVSLRFQASAPVFLFTVFSSIRQGSGRGSVVGANGFAPFVTVAATNITLRVSNYSIDRQYLRDRGTGFMGGPAYVRVDANYVDELGIFHQVEAIRETRLQSGRSNTKN